MLSRRMLLVVTAFLCLLSCPFASAQAYTSVVIFGDSLSDIGNDATVSATQNTVAGQVPGPASNYTLGRFTDGTDTVPAAHNYFGNWIDQLSGLLPAHPTITNSLAGGTDYAYGFATTNTGTSVFTYPTGVPLPPFSVNNMGQQVADYLATRPTITNKTLFIVWGGANDLLAATTPADITAAATRDIGIVQQLIAAGATDIIVPNLPPLGLVPRLNGSPTTSVPATQAALGFNQALAVGLTQLKAAFPSVRIFQLDIATLFNTIVGPPVGYGFANVTASSQLKAVNPDTYLFWDDLHPTTYGHSLIAASAFALIGTAVTTTTTVQSSNLHANLNSSVTFTATVTGTSGIPIGTVAFLDAGVPIGTSLLSGGTATVAPTATFTSSALTAGTHTITASFTGVNGYANSTSTTAVSEVVTAPAFAASLTSTTLTVASGSSVTTMLTVTPVGGYSGTATFSCGTLPAHFSCSFTPASVTLGSNTAQTTTLSISTLTASAALTMPAKPGTELPEIYAALGVLPCLGLVGLAAFRRRRSAIRSMGLMVLFAVLSGVAALGLSGCGSSTNPNAAPAGSYTVPVNVTSNGSTQTTNLTVVVQ